MVLCKTISCIYMLILVNWSQQIPTITDNSKPAPLEVNDYRLDNDVVPINYNITLNLEDDFFVKKEFGGIVKITFKLADSANPKTFITLNANHLTDVEVNLFKETETINTTYEYKEALDRIMISLDNEEVIQGEEYVVEIEYKGSLRTDMKGFYLSQYTSTYGNVKKTEWLAVTQFEPTHARKAFPCFDEPHFRANFSVTIRHPLKYKALSNGRLWKKNEIKSKIESIFETTPPMSTYLLAFVVSKFANVNEFNDHVGDNSIWVQSELIAQTKYALSFAPKITEELDSYTKIHYKENMRKMDQIAVPDFLAGAMENWGLITYRESRLLHDEHESPNKNKQIVACIITHEITHMWFGNLVTLKWWSSTWLNEGFARYFQFFATNNIEKWELDKQFVIEQQHSILVSDASESSKALTLHEEEVLTPEQISERFGTITYSKGASVIRMVKHIIGEEAFKTGLQRYLNQFKLNNTIPSDLWNSLDENSDLLPNGKSLNEVMESWTDQPGFPVVTVTEAENKKDVIVEQTRFLWSNTNEESRTGNKAAASWYIPITYTTSKNPNFNDTRPAKWLLPNSKVSEKLSDVLEENSWILLNIKDSAYYRVNYGNLWTRIKENALNAAELNKIDVLNRAQIVDDVLNLARANIVDYNMALDVVSYLENEIDYYPWYAAFNAFAYLKRRINPEHEVAKKLNEYITLLMDKIYKSVSFDVKSTSQIGSYKRALVINWACKLGFTECHENAVNAFELFRKNFINVDPDLRETVYCTAIRNSDTESNWEFLKNRLQNTKIPSEIAIIITALGCSSQKLKLEQYLEDSIDPASYIRDQDVKSVYTSVISAGFFGLQSGVDFLKKRFKDMKERYDLSSIITSTIDRFTTEEEIDMFETFIKENKDELGTAATSSENALKEAKENLVWFEENKSELLEFLDSKLVTSIAPTESSTTLMPSSTTERNGAISIGTLSNTILVFSILKVVVTILFLH